MLIKLIKKNRAKLEFDLPDPINRKKISPILYAQYKITIPLTNKYVFGDLLDAGCGLLPYRDLIKNHVNRYDGYDIKQRNKEIKFIGSIMDMNQIKEKTYDSVVCFEVLEHVHDPNAAISEFNRILRKNGYVIASVPHLSRLHEEPNDYFRFTKYGLAYIFKNKGFTIVRIVKKAGLFSFLGHQISSFLVPLFWTFPLIRTLILWLNYILITLPCFWLDLYTDKNGLFAQGYVIVAKKI